MAIEPTPSQEDEDHITYLLTDIEDTVAVIISAPTAVLCRAEPELRQVRAALFEVLTVLRD